MRPIKFRGKRELTGEWVYGFFTMGGYIPTNPDPGDSIVVRHIIDNGILNDVEPETVGQFTGLCDKNGKPIYEGDIVRHDENGKCYEIVYEAPMWRFKENEDGFAFLNHPELLTVVGNVYDNKELLKGGPSQ